MAGEDAGPRLYLMYGVTQYDIWSCDKISQVLPPLFFRAGQSSYVELLHGRKEGEPGNEAR